MDGAPGMVLAGIMVLGSTMIETHIALVIVTLIILMGPYPGNRN